MLTSVKLIIGAGFALCLAAVGGFVMNRAKKNQQRKPIRQNDCIDGGTVRRSFGENMPKTVESTEITDFSAVISTIADANKHEYSGCVFTMTAKLNGDEVAAELKWRDRYGNGDSTSFTADTAFMVELQKIVSDHELAKLNGYSHFVSGLPDMYGAQIDVRYASDESITADDNQCCFLSHDVIRELAELFRVNTVTSVQSMTLRLCGMRGTSVYEIVNTDGECELRRYDVKYSNGEDILELDKSVGCRADVIAELMNSCNVLCWDGFVGDQPDDVLDGIMFTFEATVNGGRKVSAEGSANFPDGYRAFVRALGEMLS